MLCYVPIEKARLEAEEEIRKAIDEYKISDNIYGITQSLMFLPRDQMLDSLDSLLAGSALEECKKQSIQFSADLMYRIASLSAEDLTVVGGELSVEMLWGCLINCAREHKISLAAALQYFKSIIGQSATFSAALPSAGEDFFDKVFKNFVNKPVLLKADIDILYNLIIFNLDGIYTSMCLAGVARARILYKLISKLEASLSIIIKIKHQAKNKEANNISIIKIEAILLFYLMHDYSKFSSFQIVKLVIQQVGFNILLLTSQPNKFQKLSQEITLVNFIHTVTNKKLVKRFSQLDDRGILIRVASLFKIYFALARNKTEKSRENHFELLSGACKQLKHELVKIENLKFIVVLYSLVGFATKYNDLELDSALILSNMIKLCVTADEFAAQSRLVNRSLTSQIFSLCHLKPGGGLNESVMFMIYGVAALDFNVRNFDVVMKKIHTLWIKDKPDNLVEDYYTAVLSLCISRVVSLSGEKSVFDYIYAKFNEIHLREFVLSFFSCKSSEGGVHQKQYEFYLGELKDLCHLESIYPKVIDLLNLCVVSDCRALFLREAYNSFALFCKERLLLSMVEEDSFKKSFEEKLNLELSKAEDWSCGIIDCSGNYVFEGCEGVLFYGNGNSADDDADAASDNLDLLQLMGEESSFVRK